MSDRAAPAEYDLAIAGGGLVGASPPNRASTRATGRRAEADARLAGRALRLRALRAPQRALEAVEVMRRALIVDVTG